MAQCSEVARSHSQQQLVVGSDAGTLTLFRYPCCTPGAKGRVSYGHGSHVSAVVWSAEPWRTATLHDDRVLRCLASTDAVDYQGHCHTMIEPEPEPETETEMSGEGARTSIELPQGEAAEPDPERKVPCSLQDAFKYAACTLLSHASWHAPLKSC